MQTKEEKAEYQKKWHKDNLEYYKKRYKINPEKAKEKQKKYDEANPVKVKTRAKKWYANNTEKAKRSVVLWRKVNPEKVKVTEKRERENITDAYIAKNNNANVSKLRQNPIELENLRIRIKCKRYIKQLNQSKN